MKINLIIICMALVMLGGCAQQGGVKYYWGDYSQTLYALKEDPSPDTELRHIEELQEIIQVSAEKGFKIPPGVQAELGYRFSQKGQMDQAQGYLNGEMTTYPESRFFIERLQGMSEE